MNFDTYEENCSCQMYDDSEDDGASDYELLEPLYLYELDDDD